ncbi:hypothetical protein [Legionella saoudiensis]|uniref:hypothetical protein n=1 Tax=Legionella saoudiensis TaxID=1750561 RepID=UPI0007305859|nr:hypothetical protein [Legionella saoudiensis]
MKTHDPALYFSNPRLLSAVYFGLLSVVGTILIDAFLSLIGIEDIVPLFEAIIVGMVVASATGAIFGKQIIYCPKPYMKKTFAIGFIMVILSLPFFALGLVFFMDKGSTVLFSIPNFKHLVYSYLVILGYSYILFGILLAIAAGGAAIYLRGWLVYDILHTDKRKHMRLPRFVSAQARTKTLRKAHATHHKKI